MKVSSMEGWEVVSRCPFCGRLVLGNRELGAFRHEAPRCDDFFKLLEKKFPSFRWQKGGEDEFLVREGAGGKA